MGKSNSFLISILVLLLIACIDRTDYNKLLVEADSLMQSHPDSALHLLESLQTGKLNTEADSAYYALLLTYARDKNYIRQTDDSLILSAIAYYNQTDNLKMQARAYYYCGCTYRISKDMRKSITCYLTAETLAQKIKDYHLLKLIYNNISYIYYAQDLNEQADSIYQKTEQIAILLKDSALHAEIISQRGMIQMEKGSNFYPKAEKLMLQALHTAEFLNNCQLDKKILSTLTILYNRMRNVEKSIEFAKRNLAMQEDTTHCYNAFYLLGDAYNVAKQYDSATYYLHKASPSKDYAIKAGVYLRLSDIAKAAGDFKTSLEMEQNYSTYLDSLQHERSHQANVIISAEKDTRIVSQQKENDEYRQYLLLLVMIGAVVILYILLNSRNRTIHLKEEKERLEEIQTAIQQQNNALKIEQQKKGERIAYLEKEMQLLHHDTEQEVNLHNELNKLKLERSILLEDTLKHSEVEAKMKHIINDYKERDRSELTMKKADWLQLIAETDRRWNNITSRLCTKYKLSEEEINLCCLYLTDLPISYFGCLLNCKRDTIHKKANRIVENKMGFEHGSTSLQKALKEFY